MDFFGDICGSDGFLGTEKKWQICCDRCRSEGHSIYHTMIIIADRKTPSYL